MALKPQFIHTCREPVYRVLFFSTHLLYGGAVVESLLDIEFGYMTLSVKKIHENKQVHSDTESRSNGL